VNGPEGPRPSRRSVGWAFVVAPLVLAALVCVAALVPPAGWSPRPADPVAAELRGEELERLLSSEFTRIRPDGDAWAIRLREEDLNAWIATRFPKWEASVGNPPPPAAAVRCDDGTLRVHVAAESIPGSPVVAMAFTPAVDADGLRLGLAAVSVGRVRLPWIGPSLLGASVLAAGVGPLVLPGGIELAHASDDRPLTARYGLSDGRIVELHAIAVEAESLVLEFRTWSR